MIDERAAQQIAERERAKWFGQNYVIEDAATEEHTFGWVFFVVPSPESGIDPSEVFGNGPFIVDRRDGTVHQLGTREPYEEVIERFAKTGSIHARIR